MPPLTRAEQLRLATQFSWQLARARGETYASAWLRREPMARAMVRPWHDDPYPQYALVRQRGAIVRGRVAGVWIANGHAACKQILTSRAFGVGGRQAGAAGDDQADLSLLQMDPPDHTRLRRVVAPAFTPRRMAAYAVTIEERVERYLDEMQAAGSFDLVPVFAAPLPIGVISDLLGVSVDDEAKFLRYGATLGTALDGVHSLRHARQLLQATSAIDAMFGELAARRRAEPRDDMVSMLVTQPEGTIHDDEIFPLCQLLLVAGFETTVNLIGNAVRALLAHPQQWRALVDDPRLAVGAVEETLRWDPPIQFTSREVQKDTEVAGRSLRAGHEVIVGIAGANRDPDRFSDPDRFDITRTDTGDHLAFSSGAHYCVGAPLARLEAEIALRRLAARMPDLHPAGKAKIRSSRVIRGASAIPVSVR